MMLANGILTRFPITREKFAWINQPMAGGGYEDEYRVYVEAGITIEGSELNVGTTHMSYTHKFESTPEKQVEADLLLKELSRHKTSFIFSGDLNALPGSYTIEKVGSILHGAGPDFAEKTWTTKPFSYNGFKETDLNWRLDYVFATDDIKFDSSKILSTGYSDHLPIYVQFALN